MLSNDHSNASSSPPLAECYKILNESVMKQQLHNDHQDCEVIAECELPVIDMRCLTSCKVEERQACVRAVAKASSEWGFFQVLNHGISPELLKEMNREQIKLFKLPFDEKVSSGILGNSYTWGTQTARNSKQFSWSEAFHVPVAHISDDSCFHKELNSLRDVMKRLADSISGLAHLLARVLAENLGYRGYGFPDNCNKSSCFIRLNHYPSCPFMSKAFGLVPHTDSDFLTILYQDQVGGLQLMKDSKWVSVKPNPDALIVNIGDLFQAWSNDIYKSVQHKVMANPMKERYSIGFFLCPSYNSVIGSYKEPSHYKAFTFGDYRNQVTKDVKETGQKFGLSRFKL